MKQMRELGPDDIREAIVNYVEKVAGFNPSDVEINVKPKYDMFDRPTGGWIITSRVTE